MAVEVGVGFIVSDATRGGVIRALPRCGLLLDHEDLPSDDGDHELNASLTRLWRDGHAVRMVDGLGLIGLSDATPTTG